MSMDFSEVVALSQSIGRASADVVGEARKVVSKGALNIKKDTQNQLKGHGWWTGLARTVNYDLVGLSANVGFDDAGQGELAGIHEFGSSKRGPHPTLYPAADREAPRFEKAIADVAAKVIEDAL